MKANFIERYAGIAFVLVLFSCVLTGTVDGKDLFTSVDEIKCSDSAVKVFTECSLEDNIIPLSECTRQACRQRWKMGRCIACGSGAGDAGLDQAKPTAWFEHKRYGEGRGTDVPAWLRVSHRRHRNLPNYCPGRFLNPGLYWKRLKARDVNVNFRERHANEHPKGLYFLFFTEMWERFSYYGMRSLLVYYMTKHLLLSQGQASRVYGIYTGLVYFTPFFGGLLADRYLGKHRSVILGAVLMAIGCIMLGMAFLIMALAAGMMGSHGKSSMLWTVAFVFLLTVGELYLSPIGLSLITKVSPLRMTSMMVGVWFLANFIGNCLSGILGTFWEKMPKGHFFLSMALIGFSAGFGMLVGKRLIRSFSHNRPDI